MKPIYQAVVDDIDQQIEQLRTARNAVLAAGTIVDVARIGATNRATHTPRRGRARLSGSEDLVLSLVREGHDTAKALITAAKVKPHVVRQALKALKAAGKVTTTGATATLRYRAAK